MSQLDIKIRKLQDNGSTFRANIETLYLGGVRSAKVDRLHFEVPEGCYFMMGDNRNYSMDARRWENTYVKREKIIAKVLFRYFPKPGILK